MAIEQGGSEHKSECRSEHRPPHPLRRIRLHRQDPTLLSSTLSTHPMSQSRSRSVDFDFCWFWVERFDIVVTMGFAMPLAITMRLLRAEPVGTRTNAGGSNHSELSAFSLTNSNGRREEAQACCFWGLVHRQAIRQWRSLRHTPHLRHSTHRHDQGEDSTGSRIGCTGHIHHAQE